MKIAEWDGDISEECFKNAKKMYEVASAIEGGANN